MGVRRTAFGVVALTATTLSIGDVQGALGQLPQVPKLPGVPSLQKPVEVPQTPVRVPEVRVPVPLPEVRVPAPELPRTPGVQAPATPSPELPQAPRTPGAAPQAPPPAGAGQQPAQAGDAASATPRQGNAASVPVSERVDARRQRRQQARRDRAPRTQREQRLRETVTGLWACSYAVGGVQRKVLERRAGLGGNPPLSVRGTARSLGLTPRAVRRAQRTGLRGLRRASRADGCAMGSATRPREAQEAQAIVAVATAPDLQPVAGITRRRAPTSVRAQAEVLGSRASSVTPGRDEGDARPGRAQLAAAGNEGAPLLGPLVLMLALAAGTVLLVRRRSHAGASNGSRAVPVAPPQIRPEPSREPWAARRREPAEPEPEPEAPPPPAQPPPEARRAVGLALSGLASVAIGLLVRARRRR